MPILITYAVVTVFVLILILFETKDIGKESVVLWLPPALFWAMLWPGWLLFVFADFIKHSERNDL